MYKDLGSRREFLPLFCWEFVAFFIPTMRCLKMSPAHLRKEVRQCRPSLIRGLPKTENGMVIKCMTSTWEELQRQDRKL